MALKLRTVGVDPTAVPLAGTVHSEEIILSIVPLTPGMERRAQQEAKVRITQGGTYLDDAERLMLELSVAVIDAWVGIIDEKDDQPAPITRQTVEAFLDAGGGDMLREAVVKARELYSERYEAQLTLEGNS